MQPEWVPHLLALYGALAAAMLLSLFLWISAKLEMRRYARRHAAARDALEAQLAACRAEGETVRAELAALAAAVGEMQEISGALVPPAPARSGLNLSARSQVLRRNRSGEEPAAIAAALGLPRAEVDLLLKVNRIVVENL